VGIASGRLRVASGDDEGTQLNAWSTAGGDGNLAAFNLLFNTGSNSARTERMRIDSSGNLLVGTTTQYGSTGITLQQDGLVYARRAAVPAYLRRDGSDGDIIYMEKDGTKVGSIGTVSSRLFIGNDDTFLTFQGASDRIYPASSSGGGRDAAIDLGASGTRFKDLYLSGAISVRTAIENGTAQFKTINANTAEPNEQFYVGNNQSDVDLGNKRGGLKFFTTATERMRIDSSGKLLVGTTAGSFGARITAESTTSYTFESVRTGTGPEGHIAFKNANGAVGTIFTNGSSTSYNTSSDYRLKENIADADDAGYKIDSIQVRKYDWKADGSHQDYGMIAQELQAVAPEAVSGDADSEEMMGVDYSKLVPMLIKEIQSLRNRVAQLETGE